jgi:hypothetical protein
MGREEEELKAAKRGYTDAERDGNFEERARWGECDWLYTEAAWRVCGGAGLVTCRL